MSEVAAVDTVVSFDNFNTHTSVSPLLVTFSMTPQTMDQAVSTFTATVDGTETVLTAPFTTTWIFTSTTVELSFAARTSAFIFTGEGSTEVTIQGEHTHLTVDGVETAVDIPGITTTLTAMGSTNVIVTLPEVITSIEVPETSFEFSVARETLATVDGTDSSYVCGTDTQTTYNGGGSGADTTKGCVVGTMFTLTLPTSADELYLHADGLTTSFQLAGITTTFTPKQTIFVSLHILL